MGLHTELAIPARKAIGAEVITEVTILAAKAMNEMPRTTDSRNLNPPLMSSLFSNGDNHAGTTSFPS